MPLPQRMCLFEAPTSSPWKFQFLFIISLEILAHDTPSPSEFPIEGLRNDGSNARGDSLKEN